LKRNNLMLLSFHIILTSLLFKLLDINFFQYDKAMSLTIYFGLLLIYFLYGYIFGKFFIYQNSKLKNLLSQISLVVVPIILFIIVIITFFLDPHIPKADMLAFLIYLTSPVLNLFDDPTTGSQILTSYLTLFTYVIATWLGLELRNRNRNGLNKDIKKEESVE